MHLYMFNCSMQYSLHQAMTSRQIILFDLLQKVLLLSIYNKPCVGHSGVWNFFCILISIMNTTYFGSLLFYPLGYVWQVIGRKSCIPHCDNGPCVDILAFVLFVISIMNTIYFTACDSSHWGAECQNRCDCGVNVKQCDSRLGCVVCYPGWQGQGCVDNVNECTTTPGVCGLLSTCVDTDGSYYCLCDEGYRKGASGVCEGRCS